MKVKKKRGSSWIWDNILQGKDLLLKKGRWIVGDGNSIRVWEDVWLDRDLRDHHNGNNILVSSLIDSTNKQ